MSSDPKATWRGFLDELGEQILPLYHEHERVFDSGSIHGRMHICRCLLFSEFMCRYYYQNTRFMPAVESVRYAVAFHDSGRQGNGPDLWEPDSAKRCEDYLKRKVPHEVAHAVGELIRKDVRAGWSLDKRIVHDADVLDIMRPCCGHGGRAGFMERSLRFLGPRDEPAARNAAIRETLIEEAWHLIQVQTS
jgi:hypothetical protein